MPDPCGWHGPVSAFLAADPGAVLTSLSAHHHRCMLMPPDAGQVTAWRHELEVLRRSLAEVAERCPRAKHWEVIFEYELPRERGRRPDVVILTGSQVLVLEFKDAGSLQQAHMDQVAAYARDLREYHAASHDKLVDPVLVLTLSAEPAYSRDEVAVTGPDDLGRVLLELERRSPDEPIDAVAWLDADYEPLPSLVTAARRIFDHEPLPHIRRAESAGIPQTLDYLSAVVEQARESGGLHLALVTGVPGSGKTLVGLQFVYQTHFGDWGGRQQAVFLSGNGPLVEVLQYALKSRVFVQDVHGFLKSYGGNQSRVPQEHIWVYDEAQRAWDANQVMEKRGHPTSEPEDFLRIGARKRSWALMVGLIGEGQEIHVGEEAGLAQWNQAIAAMPEPWVVHCPTKIAHVFTAAAGVETSDHLDLTVSLRTHLAENVQDWVANLLDGRMEQAAELATTVRKQGFDLYLTGSREEAEDYVRERYRGQEDARYGLLASSKARLNDYAIYSDYLSTRSLRVGPWFYDAPDKPLSCCRLRDPVTEFQCQGLELDFPIVCWGQDLAWDGKAWQSQVPRRTKARDPHQLRINSYRVLLSRARDGMCIWVPEVAGRHTRSVLARSGAGPVTARAPRVLPARQKAEGRRLLLLPHPRFAVAQGQRLTNQELAETFCCSGQGGMRRSLRCNALVLVSKLDGREYDDRWDREVFRYTGMGLSGDQSLDFAQNKTLANSATNGVDVFLFFKLGSNHYEFAGQVELAGEPCLETQRDVAGELRLVWMFPLRLCLGP